MTGLVLERSDASALLGRVDWDFADYLGSSFPEDINNLHWYPAAFIPQIPSILIQALSARDDEVLDPFAGSGVTLVEAARQNRKSTGFDTNPHAIDIAKAKFEALGCSDWNWSQDFAKEIADATLGVTASSYCKEHGIQSEVFKWFHGSTLSELLAIHELIADDHSNFGLLKRIIFSAILKSSCSQRKHYTYITDGCFPKDFIRIPAKSLYISHLGHAQRASERVRNHYEQQNGKKWNIPQVRIEVGDARDIPLKDSSINLIVTSPPYLGCNDYVRSMRLTYLFFPITNRPQLENNEIGARCKRRRSTAYDEYLSDMKKSLTECRRVLSEDGYFALVYGQGKGQVRKSNVVLHFWEYLEQLGFSRVFDSGRKIKFHRIRFPGVMNEHIAVFRSPDS